MFSSLKYSLYTTEPQLSLTETYKLINSLNVVFCEITNWFISHQRVNSLFSGWVNDLLQVHSQTQESKTRITPVYFPVHNMCK